MSIRPAPRRAHHRALRDHPTRIQRAREAARLVDVAGVMPVLEQLTGQKRGRRRALPDAFLLTAFTMYALESKRSALLTEVALHIRSLDDADLDALGYPDVEWNRKSTYDYVTRFVARLAAALETAPVVTTGGREVTADARWFANAFLMASIPRRVRRRIGALAVDGTAMVTWARYSHTLAIEAAATPDGRVAATADPGARGGYRTATGKGDATEYIGYELHLGTAVPAIEWTDAVNKVRFSDDLPPVAAFMTLAAAGTHRGEAVASDLVDLKSALPKFDEVIVDRGYTSLSYGSFLGPLRDEGICATFDLVSHQTTPRPVADGVIGIGGTLYPAALPQQLLTLARVPNHPTVEQFDAHVDAFNRRAEYRYTRHGGTKRWRFRSPIDAGRIRCKTDPASMRRAFDRPELILGTDAIAPPDTLTIDPSEVPLHQPTVWQTTAWHLAYGRRNLSETTNSRARGDYLDLNDGWCRLFGLVKRTIMLAFAVAGMNLDIVRSWKAKHDRTPKDGRRKTRDLTELYYPASEPIEDLWPGLRAPPIAA